MRKLVLAALMFGGLAMTAGCPADDEGLGFFQLDWVLTDAAGAGITCAQAGADSVEVLTTLQGGTGVADLYDCTAMGATTPGLPLGTYTVQVSILDTTTDPDDVLGQSQPRSGVLTFDGELVDLGVFNFAFGGGGPGDVTFVLDYDVAGGSNCTAGGADDVDDQETTLQPAGGGACIPTQLDAGQDGVANICNEFAPCIESNVTQTLVAVDAGDYDLLLQGLFTNGASSTACYSASIPVTVDGDVDLGTVLVPFDDTKDPGFCMGI